jgi:hypothetical protein
MSFEFAGSQFLGSLSLTMLVSVFTLAATGIPFYRGLRVFFEALSATRRVESAELRKPDNPVASRDAEALAQLLVRVIRKSIQESADHHPSDFIVDASRQYVMNEYDAHYARRISMYANILPPIGFIGTTTGLFILFLSMRVASESLELVALALALTSSIFALVGFAILEGLKIFLYGRMLASLSHVLSLHRPSPVTRRSPRADPAKPAASTA